VTWTIERAALRRRVKPALKPALAVVLIAAALLAVGGILGAHPSPSDRSEAVATRGSATASAARLDTAIAAAQQRLRRLPGDYVTWAALGSAYLEKARITADPGWYPKSEGALRRSLAVRPKDNTTALTGLGALANSRHDFATGRTMAQQALRQDPYNADAYGVLADAETQLGNTAAATAAVQHMLDVRPGLAALTRGSYDLEQRGRITEARALMRQALTAAVDPADIAFCRYQLGELAWTVGDLAGAQREYAAGLDATPDYLPLQQGTAKLAAAQGKMPAALAGYATLTSRSPTPTYLLDYAELLRAAGGGPAAEAQLTLADAADRLFAANGGKDDLTAAALALARNRPAEALASARREWKRRHFADVADMMAQALHANGRNAEALRYARLAAAPGARNARYLYHQGLIEAALGQTAAARRDLTAALTLNPHFSPLDAPAAHRALAGLAKR
jgi:tetratricopeptide (TPR) repeat protein